MDDANNSAAARVGRQLFVATLATAAFGTQSAVAASDIFLKIGDIKGESADSRHKDEIDVLAWSWGVGSAPDAKGRPQPACSQALLVDKFVDRATPALVTAVALGTLIPSAKVTVRRGDEKPLEFVVLSLVGVTAKSLSYVGSREADRLTEKLALAFNSATITYTPQAADGSGGASVSAIVPGTCP